MEITFATIIGFSMTGLMGVIWWDVRGIRKSTQKDMAEFKQEITNSEYLPEEKHVLLCENASLRFERIVSDMKDEIIKEIKNNNRRKET